MMILPTTATPTAADVLPLRSAAAIVPPASAAATTLGQQMRDRRRGQSPGRVFGRERRQFASSHDDLSGEGRELAMAIDDYKLKNQRRYVTADELLSIMRTLGYAKKELGGTIDRRV